MDELITLFASEPTTAAKRLLGSAIVVDERALSITEVEAYGGVGQDPASHAFRRRTQRNSVMFDRPGLLYVYFTYGMHWCANVVAHLNGHAGAVLLRGTHEVVGPARICSYLGITGADNGNDLLDPKSRVRLHIHEPVPPDAVRESTRIGISQGQELPWRYFIDGEPTSTQRHPRPIRQDSQRDRTS